MPANNLGIFIYTKRIAVNTPIRNPRKNEHPIERTKEFVFKRKKAPAILPNENTLSTEISGNLKVLKITYTP